MRSEALVSKTSLQPVRPTIRPLTADDSVSYRALRQKILAIGDGKYFSDSYDRENKFVTEQQWREWCTETHEHCTFGIFVDLQLIGIIGIVQYGAPEDLTVEWEAVWLEPRYRKQGIAKLAYEKVQQWTEDRGYKCVVSHIRADNMRALEIRRNSGAVYTHTERNAVWADGSIADYHCFMLVLDERKSGELHHRVLSNLEAALESLDEEVPAAAQEAVAS